MQGYANTAKVLRTVTEVEARAILEALDQYVTNGHDYIDQEDEPDPATVARFKAAAAVLDRMNAEIAKLADEQ